MKYLLFAFTFCLVVSSCNKDVSGSGACYLSTLPYTYSQGGARFLLPNAFTPNGDGRNDRFRPIGITGITNFSMTVFDKNGNTIFRTNDLYTSGWDGRTTSGIPVEDGKYTVEFQFNTVNGDNVSKSACVALLSYAGSNCLTRSIEGNYYFEDQFDTSTPGNYYPTLEVICP